MITRERKKEIVKEFSSSEQNTGSAAVQIALISEHISAIAAHLKKFPKDKHSHRGLLKLVGKKHRLSVYLERIDRKRYLEVIKKIKG